MPLSHLVFQYALLKLFGGVQGLGGDKLLSHYPLVWPCNKPFSAPNSSLFGLTVHQAQGLALDNSLFLFPLTVNIFLMATMTILWSEPWWWNDNLVSRVERLENIDPGQYTEPQNPTMLKPDYPLSRLPDIWTNSLSNFDLSFLLPENFYTLNIFSPLSTPQKGFWTFGISSDHFFAELVMGIIWAAFWHWVLWASFPGYFLCSSSGPLCLAALLPGDCGKFKVTE